MVKTQAEYDAMSKLELFDVVPPMSDWLHENGHTYRAAFLTNTKQPRKEDYPVTVMYFDIADNEYFSKPIAEFLAKRVRVVTA
jgi:hypothetical protein